MFQELASREIKALVKKHPWLQEKLVSSGGKHHKSRESSDHEEASNKGGSDEEGNEGDEDLDEDEDQSDDDAEPLAKKRKLLAKGIDKDIGSCVVLGQQVIYGQYMTMISAVPGPAVGRVWAPLNPVSLRLLRISKTPCPSSLLHV